MALQPSLDSRIRSNDPTRTRDTGGLQTVPSERDRSCSPLPKDSYGGASATYRRSSRSGHHTDGTDATMGKQRRVGRSTTTSFAEQVYGLVGVTIRLSTSHEDH